MFPIPEKFEPTNNYVQLELFEPTFEMCMEVRMKTVEQKCEKYRKAQFGKITRAEKRITELEERLSIIERGLCRNELIKNDCEILSIGVI